jgi:restriction system protein
MESSDNVVAAFEMLLEEIETQVSLLEKDNAKAWKDWDFNQAGELVKSAEMITAFREEVLQLQQKWESLFPDEENDTNSRIELTEKESVARNSHGRLKRGMRTREQEFRLPILKILVAKGGSASMKVVLEELEKLLHGILKDVDYDSLPSDPDTIRWRNTAQWSRQALVNEGLLKTDSPRGIWEISEAGRAYLENNK